MGKKKRLEIKTKTTWQLNAVCDLLLILEFETNKQKNYKGHHWDNWRNLYEYGPCMRAILPGILLKGIFWFSGSRVKSKSLHFSQVPRESQHFLDHSLKGIKWCYHINVKFLEWYCSYLKGNVIILRSYILKNLRVKYSDI